jgi:hypothetical protein
LPSSLLEAMLEGYFGITSIGLAVPAADASSLP